MTEQRAFRFTFEIEVPASKEPVQLWVPHPLEDAWQTVQPPRADVALHRIVAGGERVEIAFDVVRKSRLRELAPVGADVADSLAPNRKVPLDRAAAVAIASPDEPPLIAARKLFDHLIGTLDYDTGGCTPERSDQLGDLVVACDLKRGTCTEFHGLFVSYARSLGIPARFCFGFNVPPKRPSGRIAGYHCWAEVALPDGGWMPVDVSEAWKHPDSRDFYFGSLDCNRIAFNYGRDVNLTPRQHGEPLDKFIFPYAEAGGVPVTLGLSFRFEERPGAT